MVYFRLVDVRVLYAESRPIQLSLSHRVAKRLFPFKTDTVLPRTQKPLVRVIAMPFPLDACAQLRGIQNSKLFRHSIFVIILTRRKIKLTTRLPDSLNTATLVLHLPW